MVLLICDLGVVRTLLTNFEGGRKDLAVVSVLDLSRAPPLLALVSYLIHMNFFAFLESKHDALFVSDALHFLVRHVITILTVLLLRSLGP